MARPFSKTVLHAASDVLIKLTHISVSKSNESANLYLEGCLYYYTQTPNPDSMEPAAVRILEMFRRVGIANARYRLGISEYSM